ncbi:MAG: tRNA epoxyqueuosine(34) reductase QueG [Phycisphaerales bacterium]|nr:MAG: tRNA epoxyqueuosine(34) reductase QueG [Phycisphaerales bacterium]
MTETRRTEEVILSRCRELGFAPAGIARAEPTAYEDELRAWLAAGRNGEMAYLKRHEELLVDPARMVEGARSIICVADRYWNGAHDDDDRSQNEAVGGVARYARGDDYHVVIKSRLRRLCDELRQRFPQETFQACVDTVPLLEREHAQRAGLGAVGKNTLLIRRGEGSYFLLGEIVTTLDLEPSEPARPDPCGPCTRCIDACPTNAITPWSVDATRCTSYLTIEHRSAIDPALFPAIDNWIFGCDICQEVCPHNLRKGLPAVHDSYTPRRTAFDLLEVLNWTEDDRRAAFTKSAMKRARLEMMKRNALIAAGNALAAADQPALLARIESLARDDSEPQMVRDTAVAVLANLAQESP